MKRLLATLLTLLTLASLLTSCESSTDTSDTTADHYQTVAQVDIEQNATRIEPDPNEWVVKYLEMPEHRKITEPQKYYYDEEKQTVKFVHSANVNYYIANNITEYDQTKAVIEYDMRGNVVSDKPLPNVGVKKDFFYIRLTEYGFIGFRNINDSYELCKYYEDTGEVECVLQNLKELTSDYTLDVIEDSDGNYHIFANPNSRSLPGNKYMVYSPDGTVLFDYESNPGMKVTDEIVEYNGRVYITTPTRKVLWEANLETNEFDYVIFPDVPEGLAYIAPNPATAILPEMQSQQRVTEFNAYRLGGDENNSAYYVMPDGVYAQSIDDPTNAELIVNLEASGLTLSLAEIEAVLSPTCILANIANIFTYDPSLPMSTKPPALIYFDDTRETASRQVITLAHIYNMDSTFRSAIAYFNMTNPSYRIETVDYSTFDDPIALIEKEFGAGKYHDMMLIPSSGMDFTNLTAKGFIANLCDLGFDADSMIPSVRSAVEYGGGIYRLPMTFTYSALINREGIEAMTVDDMLSMYGTYGNSLFRQFDRELLWDYLVQAGVLADFVDYGSATCSFDDENFVRLLEFMRSYNNVPLVNRNSYGAYGLDEDYLEILDGGGIFLHSLGRLRIGELSSYEYFYGEGGYSISGFPTGEGSGIVIRPQNEICVMKAAASYEGAMEFIDLVYSSDQARDYFWKDVMRTNKEIQVDYMRELLTYEEYATLFNSSTNVVMDFTGSDHPANPNYIYFEIGDDALDYFVERIFDAEVRPADDVGLLDILDDELTTYLGGQGDARGTAARVQSRARIYLSERYG